MPLCFTEYQGGGTGCRVSLQVIHGRYTEAQKVKCIPFDINTKLVEKINLAHSQYFCLHLHKVHRHDIVSSMSSILSNPESSEVFKVLSIFQHLTRAL